MRASLPLGSCTSRVGGRDGWARDAVAISIGRCAWRIGGWEERRTKIAAKWPCFWVGLRRGAVSEETGSSGSSVAGSLTVAEFVGSSGRGSCEEVSRIRVILLNPTTMESAMAGGGGRGSASFFSVSAAASFLFRFFSRLPFDLMAWFRRYCPTVERMLRGK